MDPHFISDQKEFCISRYFVNGKWDGETWIIISDLRFKIDGRIHKIPAGFITNFGSIPRLFRITLDRMGKSIRGFVVHDWIYSNKCGCDFKQRDCDEILYLLSRQDGESWCSAQKINKGLMLGGWTCYKKGYARVSEVSPVTVNAIIKSNIKGFEDEKTNISNDDYAELVRLHNE